MTRSSSKPFNHNDLSRAKPKEHKRHKLKISEFGFQIFHRRDAGVRRVRNLSNQEHLFSAPSAVVRKNPFMLREPQHDRIAVMEIQTLSRSS
jgi:hypothetical protein